MKRSEFKFLMAHITMILAYLSHIKVFLWFAIIWGILGVINLIEEIHEQAP